MWVSQTWSHCLEAQQRLKSFVFFTLDIAPRCPFQKPVTNFNETNSDGNKKLACLVELKKLTRYSNKRPARWSLRVGQKLPCERESLSSLTRCYKKVFSFNLTHEIFIDWKLSVFIDLFIYFIFVLWNFHLRVYILLYFVVNSALYVENCTNFNQYLAHLRIIPMRHGFCI